MKYTVRYAHLASEPKYKDGDAILYGDALGKIGNTGHSTAPHLHLDVVQGWRADRYTLGMIEAGDPAPAPKQCNYFIDRDLFHDLPVITTYYADPDYMQIFKKLHLAYDLVPEGRHRPGAPLLIYWNRSMPGRVLRVMNDMDGYGHCLYVRFEA